MLYLFYNISYYLQPLKNLAICQLKYKPTKETKAFINQQCLINVNKFYDV